MKKDRDVTELLDAYRRGDEAAIDEVVSLVYAELKRIALRELRKERSDHTLQPTALAHEAYVRLVGQRDAAWQNRAHFLGCAARAMRNILVDHARARRAEKRGGGDARVELREDARAVPARSVDLLALDEALGRLAELNARQARVVEMRFFGGLSNEEISETLEVSHGTVSNDWNAARSWLRIQLDRP